MRDCRHVRNQSGTIAYALYILILVYTHEIEPVLLLHARLKEFDFPISESPKQSLVSDVAHAIESKLCVSLLKQNRLNLYIIRFRGSPIVVD